MGATANKERPIGRTIMARPAESSSAATLRPRPACVVVGASVRAFAVSAARSGWTVHAADLFADADLAAVAKSLRRLGPAGEAAYPDGVPGIVATLPDGPCVCTGALENHPDVIAAIAAGRPIAGASPEAIRRVRDPVVVAAIARGVGLRFPSTVTSPAGLPTDGRVLVKPRRSAGGRAITAWRGDAASLPADPLWQHRVVGEAWSAAYLATRSSARLVAASRCLVGTRWCGSGGFRYSGSIDAPLGSVPDPMRHDLERLGAAIVAASGIVGLFGVDLMRDDASTLHVLEVNPRPTASMELLERATGWSVAGGHLAACGFAAEPRQGSPTDGVWAKAIVSTPRSRSIRPTGEAIAAFTARWTADDGWPAVADIPAAGEVPAPGTPLVTVFARGDGHEDALAALRRRVLTLRRFVATGISPPSAAASAGRRRRGNTA